MFSTSSLFAPSSSMLRPSAFAMSRSSFLRLLRRAPLYNVPAEDMLCGCGGDGDGDKDDGNGGWRRVDGGGRAGRARARFPFLQRGEAAGFMLVWAA